MTLNPGQLIGFGFAKAKAVGQLLQEHPVLESVVAEAGLTGDPDLTVLQLARLIESGCDLEAQRASLGPELWRRLLYLLGGSRALGDFLLTHLDSGPLLEPVASDLRGQMIKSVGANPEDRRPVANIDGNDEAAVSEAVSALRLRYHQLLAAVAAEDLADPAPTTAVRMVSSRLAILADSALEASLAVARAVYDPEAQTSVAVLALGKTGAQELNYISDVDVMYVVPDEATLDEISVVNDMVRAVAAYCSAPGDEAPLWTLDAGLRPEGKDGPLVRTLGSMVDYYERWAQNWEFQALLKARACAGDLDLGESLLSAVEPQVWSAASRPGFVRGMQDMRRDVEDSVRASERGREIKLSAGGLRDVEFTVQLLQLVHGQTDPNIHSANTLDAIEQLVTRGYIGRKHAQDLAEAYRFLRLTEHRIQLQAMRRTHSLPSSTSAQRALARSVGPGQYRTYAEFEAELKKVRRRVRALQEDVYYRPIVAATATIGEGNSQLREQEQEAEDRLRTIGYVDPAGALRSLAALTRGTSRRAVIQRNLSPVIVEWLSEGADPDMGILSFRTLSDQIGSSHWYLALLRDSANAAQRLCHILANSRWAEGALAVIPEAVAWLDSDQQLRPIEPATLRAEAEALLGRHPESDRAMKRIATLLGREVTRAGLSDCLAEVAPCHASISDAADVIVGAALQLAHREYREDSGRDDVQVLVAAMGRYGGKESSYASDVDLLFVHEPRPGVDETTANAAAVKIANRTKRLLQDHRQEGMTSIDLDLRPEGRRGIISRTVDSYREYYRRWASPWERHALLRLRPVAGEPELTEKFLALVDDLRWNWNVSDSDLREIRLLKARMENERLPRGVSPNRHVKLGPGGLTDVEWTVQLLQLRNAQEFEPLRTTNTPAAMEALISEGVVTAAEGADLQRAWNLASRVRAANVLATGNLLPERVDVLPKNAVEGRRVANLLGFGVDGVTELEDRWLFASRRARAVMDRHFWH